MESAAIEDSKKNQRVRLYAFRCPKWHGYTDAIELVRLYFEARAGLQICELSAQAREGFAFIDDTVQGEIRWQQVRL